MMNAKQLRDRVFIAHRYLGLAIGLLAVPIGLTGSLLILPSFWHDLTAAKVTPIGTKLPIATIVAKVRSIYPNLTLNSIDLPTKSTEPIVAYLGKHYIQIDPYTGNPIGQLAADNNDITGWLYQVHIQLLGGDWGGYLAGIVGLLMTVLAITGTILWPGWRKLSTGFKIKWNAKTKRLNFDLHKVVGIVAAVFLALTMGTGFIWNFSNWTNPVIYALTFSPQRIEVKEPVSTVTVDRQPIVLTETIFQQAIASLPAGETRSIHFPETPDGVVKIRKELPYGGASAFIDRYSGKVIKVDVPQQSLGNQLLESFFPLHFGTFAGTASRMLYFCVGLSPTFLLSTGFIMWKNRKPANRRPDEPQLSTKL